MAPRPASGGQIEYRPVDADWSHFQSLSADVIPLSLFLNASQVSLKFDMDDIANDYLNTASEQVVPQSYRDFGIVMLLVVDYDNIDCYWNCVRGKEPCFTYSYQLSAITKIEDFVQETVYTAYPYNRTSMEKRGVRVIGVISGQIGSFDFQVLLVQLTTSLALIKVATTVVDLIAIRLLPRKGLYKAAKYEVTEDFSDLTDKNKNSNSVELESRA
jgi:hypothetical protein